MYDTIIVGAGPAGMMASIKASENNQKVLLIEKNDRLGKKLELTGGTRCNLTNLKDVNHFIKEIPVNSKTLYPVLNQFSPMDIYNYFIRLGVSLKIEDNNRVFPESNKAKTVIEALKSKMTQHHVVFHLNEEVKKIINHSTRNKEVVTNISTYRAKNIIIATGGCSYPQTGSTGDGYAFSKELGQPLTELYPAETFVFCKKPLPLSGITLDNVIVSTENHQSNGSLLFTHFGLSGPAIFKISETVYHHLKEKETVFLNIDLIPNQTTNDLIVKLDNYNSKKEIISYFRDYLPKRLSDHILGEKDANLKIGSLSKAKKIELIEKIKKFRVEINKTGSIEKSFVTGGGVDMKYINPKTMESLKNPGIYYAGEVLDIHGHTGGYNITIALSTGYVAGENTKG